MSDGNAGENERRARIWAEMLAKIRAAYVRVGPLVPPAFGAAPSAWIAWAKRVLDISPTAAYRHAKGVRARAWLHPDRFKGVAVALNCPERVGIHFAADLLYFRYSLAVDALALSDDRLRDVREWCPHAAGTGAGARLALRTSGPNYER